MYAPKAVETLNKLNDMSIDPDISICHHHTFTHVNKRFTYNVDYVDHPDGSITGYLFGMDRHNYIISKEDFKIEPNGDIQKGVMRNFALKVKILKDK